MKKLLVVILISISTLFAIDKPNIIYLKHHATEYNATYQDIGNRTIKWVIKADKKHLLRLLYHINYMIKKTTAGITPHRQYLIFQLESEMGKYIHYKMDIKNGALIIYKKADNDCAFALMKTHAYVLKNDFFKGNLSKDYSSAAKQIINSPACKDFKHIFK